MDFLPGLLRDLREWWPTPSQFAGAGTTALMIFGLLTVLQRVQTRMFKAEAQAAALIVKDAHRTAAAEAAELVAARLKAEAVLAADVVLAAAELAREDKRC